MNEERHNNLFLFLFFYSLLFVKEFDMGGLWKKIIQLVLLLALQLAEVKLELLTLQNVAISTTALARAGGEASCRESKFVSLCV